MSPDEYQIEAQRTVMSVTDQAVRLIKAIKNDPNLSHILVGALKLNSESGELADSIVKHICYGQRLDKANIFEECGDLLWYIALILEYNGSSIDNCMTANISKLKKRYPEKYTDELAAKRLDKTNE